MFEFAKVSCSLPIKIFPLLGFKSPKIKSTIVVFPEPEGPIIKFNEFFLFRKIHLL